ncbi:uncharacterized protein DEA37_0004734 [Paragonimus westermani]|uniref:Solute carrier family 3 member 2 N-terminal domain-containing protein n=1 Tax=Paragonimus westermani TaxID=34504 RepID=A0A5J4NTB3_9TREM|nr:uncharacterized protein DEA37_0004734 [Paragonimus westermani]
MHSTSVSGEVEIPGKQFLRIDRKAGTGETGDPHVSRQLKGSSQDHRLQAPVKAAISLSVTVSSKVPQGFIFEHRLFTLLGNEVPHLMASTGDYRVYTLDDNEDRGSVIDMPTYTAAESCRMNPYLTREELRAVEDVEPVWRRLRIGLLVTFCVIWVALLVSVITIVVLSEKCPPRPDLRFWQSKVAYYVDPFAFKDSDGNWVGDLNGTPIVYYGSELGTRLARTAQPPGRVYPMNKVPNVYESADDSVLTCQLPMPWDQTGKRFSNDPNRTDQFSSYLRAYRVTETLERKYSRSRALGLDKKATLSFTTCQCGRRRQQPWWILQWHMLIDQFSKGVATAARRQLQIEDSEWSG